MRVSAKNGEFIMENPKITWMMKWAIPIVGNQQKKAFV